MSSAAPWGKRVLVLAPHPDDEVVGVAAALARARNEGAVCAVAFLTTGVPAPEVFWPWQRPGHAARLVRRAQEARAAADALGIEIALESAVPSRGLKDRLPKIRADLSSLIGRWQPDRLWVSAFEGAHQDHDAANALAATLAATLAERVPVFEFAEYNFAGGRVRPNEFPALAGNEIVLELDGDERAAKRTLLGLYASEAGNLAHVDTGRECLRPLPSHDYARPAHAGKLFRERFHWVPFRHPRIDFEPTEKVSAGLAGFLSRPS